MTWNLSREGRVARLAFDRPPDNQMNFASLEELQDLLADIGQDEDVSVVVLASDRSDYFVAHGDREDIARVVKGDRSEGSLDTWLWTLLQLEELPQPTVAAVNGQAWGGGLELALACTLRVAGPAAHFSQHEISRGAMPGAGGTQRLPRTVGLSRAAFMILTSSVLSAEDALRAGLINDVLPGEAFETEVMEWVEPVASQPRDALIAAKRALVDSTRMPLLEGLVNEQRLFRTLVRPIGDGE